MIAKTLKQNGQCIHISIYRSLTENKINDPLEIKARKHVDIAINEKLGEGTPLECLVKEQLDIDTPNNPLYRDDYDDTPRLPGSEDIYDDLYDHCIGLNVG